MATKTAMFDAGALLSGGLTFSFARAAAARNDDGTTVASGDPRYAEYSLLCAAPVVTVLDSTTAAIPTLGGGTDADGNPVFVVLNQANGEFDVYVGGDTASHRTRFDLSTTGKQSTNDILVANTTRTGGSGTAEQSDYAFTPIAVRVYRGLMVILCEAWGPNPDWATAKLSRTIAVVYATIEDIQSTVKPFVLLGVDADTTGDNSHGGAWSMTGPWSLDRETFAADSTVYFCFTDYRNPTKTGGISFLCGATWDGAAWTVNPLAAIDSATAASTHYHMPWVLRRGEGGIDHITDVGDTAAANLFSHRSLPDTETYWKTGSDTGGISGSFTVKAAADEWDAAAVVLGISGATGMSRQSIGCAPGIDSTLATLGADESSDTIVSAEFDGTLGYVNFYTLYLPAVTSVAGQLGLVFHVRRRNPTSDGTSQYLAQLSASTTSWGNAAHDESRVLYSPDGVTWGQYYCNGESQQAPPTFGPNGIYCGSSNSNGLRRLPIPNTLKSRPLRLAAGKVNALLATVSAPSPGGTNTVTAKTPAQVTALGLPLPPCQGSIFEVKGIDNSNFGFFNLTNVTIPDTFTLVRVRCWILPLAYDGVTYTSKGVPYIRARGDDGTAGTGQTGFQGSIQPSGLDKWSPATFAFEVGDFSAALTNPWNLRVQFQTGNGSNHPQQFLLAFDSVEVDGARPGGYGGAPAATLPDEVASIGTLGLGAQWTIAFFAQVPHDAWDKVAHTDVALADTPLFTLDLDADNCLEVFADTADDGLTLRSVVMANVVTDTAGDYSWVRGSPIMVVVVCDGTDLIVYHACCGRVVTATTIPNGAFIPTDILLGSNQAGDDYAAVDVFGVRVDQAALNAERVGYLLANPASAIGTFGGRIDRINRINRVKRIQRI